MDGRSRCLLDVPQHREGAGVGTSAGFGAGMGGFREEQADLETCGGKKPRCKWEAVDSELL